MQNVGKLRVETAVGRNICGKEEQDRVFKITEVCSCILR
jgi:hypothetical protein